LKIEKVEKLRFLSIFGFKGIIAEDKTGQPLPLPQTPSPKSNIHRDPG